VSAVHARDVSLPENRGSADAGPRPGPSLSVQLLQGFALCEDGRVLEVPPAAQRLIAFLALEGRRVDRLVVSGKLWIDSTNEHAAASLRTALWRLGQIRADVIRVHGPMLELAHEVRVDLTQATARAQLLVRQPEEHCDRDLEILGLAGDLLPDWYDDWVLIERERFRQLRLHALERLCRALTAAGAHAEAILAGLTGISVEPLRESSNRALIAAYAAEGNAAEGLRHYAIFKRRLDEELGLTPSPRMEMLVARLRGG
jgi:DNA-binding SARP family transcriptional activator